MRRFDAELTLLASAQVFHFEKVGESYAANVGGRILKDTDEDAFASDYFDDARDYASILAQASSVPEVRLCAAELPGLRVLNQPAWEALVAFILSSNNNVSRITKLVKGLSGRYGEPLAHEGRLYYGFPSPERLSEVSEAELRETVKCGYRAAYLIGSARMIASGFPLNALREATCEEARRELMRLPGVGGKVADCVALFGLGHADAFPVDVWVKRLMESWFHVTGTPEKVRREAKYIFGNNCGIIQQYLFHAARTGKIRV